MKNIRLLSRFVIAVFLFVMLFSTETVRLSVGENISEKETKVLDDNRKISGGVGNNLKKDLDAYQNLGERIFQSLKAIVEDEHYKDKKPHGYFIRFHAAFQMEKLRSKAVIKYQLDNITLYISELTINNSKEAQFQYPCKLSLALRGWEVIPYIFEHIRRTRSEKEMLLISELFMDICGRQMSKAILEVKKQENPPSVPENKIFNKNITFILEHIKK